LKIYLIDALLFLDEFLINLFYSFKTQQQHRFLLLDVGGEVAEAALPLGGVELVFHAVLLFFY
jgi:hypothetical protein